MRVRVPAKVNLVLQVGPLREDGYHELTTIFHALSLFDEVSVAMAPPGTGVTLDLSGEGADTLPRDSANLAVRAAVMSAERAGQSADLAISIEKAIPVAGGMAGGSADAAAVLVACSALWESSLPRQDLPGLAVALGSDVPFLLEGGTMLGSGRGEVLTPILARGDFHWVIAVSETGLSTAEVYAELDRQRGVHPLAPDGGADDVRDALLALRAGDARALGYALRNDLQPAALALRPALARVLEAGSDLGALGGVVSGSGPTCVFLARDREHALDIAVGLTTTGLVRSVRHATGPVAGAQVIR